MWCNYRNYYRCTGVDVSKLPYVKITPCYLNAQVKADNEAMRVRYIDHPFTDDQTFDVWLMDKIITQLKIIIKQMV